MKQLSIIILLLLISCIKEKYTNTETYNYSMDTKFPTPWSVVISVPPEDSNHVIKLEYSEKYGSPQIYYFKAVFYNEKTGQYKCLSPNNTLILERSNIYNINYEIIETPKL